MLGVISHLEWRNGRPPLSALVIRKGTASLGDGFLNIFSELDATHPYPALSDVEAVEMIIEDVYSEHA